LLIKSHDQKQFRDWIRGSREEANRDNATDILSILNNALERITSHFINDKYAKLKTARKKLFSSDFKPLPSLLESFENQVLFQVKKPLEWVNENLMPIDLSELTLGWAAIRLKRNSHAEALLDGYFYELFFKDYKSVFLSKRLMEVHTLSQNGQTAMTIISLLVHIMA
jgi:hypothetical protein